MTERSALRLHGRARFSTFKSEHYGLLRTNIRKGTIATRLDEFPELSSFFLKSVELMLNSRAHGPCLMFHYVGLSIGF